MSGGRCEAGRDYAVSAGMADEPKEPQSYGSQKDWQTGNVDEKVNPGDGSEENPTQKVTDQYSGAKTDSYFKKRDYK